MSLFLLGILNAQATGGAVEPESAYDLLESEILTGSQASITFSDLGVYSAYQHLQIRGVARTDRAALSNDLQMQFNGDTNNANYNYHLLYGTGSGGALATSGSTASGLAFVAGGNETSTIFGGFVCDILNPFDTNRNTTSKTLGGYGNTAIRLYSHLWKDTSAVTSITISPNTADDLVSGTRLSLYGLRSVAT